MSETAKKILSGGKAGVSGPPGPGVPVGGDEYAIPIKSAATNYALTWLATSLVGRFLIGVVNLLGLREFLGLPYFVTDFGAQGNGMVLHDAVIIAGDQTVTSVSANFPTDIVGKYVRIAGGVTAGTKQVETATAVGTILTSGTVSVTISGDGIPGSPVTIGVYAIAGDTPAVWAGRVRSYLANMLQLFDLYYAGGTGDAITLTGKREAADRVLNIALSNGTCTGVTAAPTSVGTIAGVATVDRVTQVTQRISSTSIKVALAPARPGNGVTLYYGTDDTVAIQDAIDTAAASNINRTVYFPPGVYLCNVIGKAHVHLLGADGGLTEFEFDIGGPLPDLSDRAIVPVALLPALATTPVIYYPGAGKVYGASIEKLSIFGSKEQVGCGLQLGEQVNAGSIYCGGGFRLKQVLITGFEYAFSSSKVAQMQADNCLFLYSRVCAFLGQKGLAVGATDTSVFNSCGTGGADCDAGWFISASRGITINGGDHNDSEHVAILCNGSNVTINGINSESTTGSLFVVATGDMTLNASSILHLNGPMVDAIGNDNRVSISDVRVGAAGDAAKWEGALIYYRTNQGGGQPDKLPRGGVLARYQDLGWSVLMETQQTSRLYETAEAFRRQPRLVDEFAKFSVDGSGNVRGTVMNNAAGNSQKIVYGALGWELTNLAGATPVCYGLAQPAAPGNAFGLFGVGTSTNGSANLLDFALPDEIMNATAQYWEVRWVLSYDHSGGNIKFRCGVYNTPAAATFAPTNGVGIRVDRSVPEGNIWFEVINATAVSSVDTGIPYTALTVNSEVVISRTAQGYVLKLRGAPNNAQGIAYPQVRHTYNVATALGDYVAPRFILGASASAWPNVKPDRFSLELFEP